MLTVVSFVIVLSVLVFVHELGHFAAGRLVKARIEEFAIGFPPRLLSVRRGETDYSLNAIPLGGYCRFAGEDNPDIPDGLSNLPRRKRAFVLLAGVTMNAVLAVLLFAVVYLTGYPMAEPTEGISIVAVTANSPAQQAGLAAGDVVLQVNQQAVNEIDQFSSLIRSQLGQPVTLLVKHADGSSESTTLTPRASPPAGEGPLGVSIEQASIKVTKSYPLPTALVMGARQTWRMVVITFQVPVMVLRGLIPAEAARLSGPVGIARVVGGAAEVIPTNGFAPILLTMAMLSISLAVVNILPLPAVDGGRLVFVILEWLRGGKRINPQREAIIHLAGFAFFMALVVVITYFDIVQPAPPITWGR
jgi:regulator of sigma E protease